MASKIGKKERRISIAIAGALDAAQWGIDLIPVIGEGINAVADPFLGLAIMAYFWIRGVNLIYKPKRMVSLLLSGIAEELSLEVLPAWFFDMWYIHNDIMQEQAADAAVQEQNAALAAGAGRSPKYTEQDGNMVRLPDSAVSETVSKANRIIHDIRPPNGGMKLAA